MYASPVKTSERRFSPAAQAAGRSGAMAISKTQQMANDSPQAKQLKALQAMASGTPTVQRMIIRIRDLSEMMHISKPTIMNSSKITGKEMGGGSQEKEDIGINQAIKGRQLVNGEELRIVAHGSAPSLPSFLNSGLPSLGGEAPAALATKVAGLFPVGYAGQIYMNGCYTATRLGFKAGTSYIELFAQALAQQRSDIKFVVTGNLGPAATMGSGKERIRLEKSVALLAKQLHWPVEETTVAETGEVQYKVVSPYGIAYASSDGGYNDGGLAAAFEQQQQQIEEESRRRKAPEQVELLRKDNVGKGVFGINDAEEGSAYITNDML
jgi:hypothetical protein